MREILFRGKRIDNGEWIEGYVYRISEDLNPFIMFKNRHGESHEVDPKTVGQFTGLYTVSEQKIWSGDIARFYEKLYTVQRECDTPGGYWAETGYILKHIGWSDYVPFTDTIDDYYNEICIEIVGNIHDNPELLEVSHNA